MEVLDHIEMAIEMFVCSQERPKLVSKRAIGQTQLYYDLLHNQMKLALEQTAAKLVEQTLDDMEFLGLTRKGRQKEKEDGGRTDSR